MRATIKTLSPTILLAVLVVAATAEFKTAIAQSELELSTPVILKPGNESVNVVVSWDPKEIEPSQDVEFDLDFQHPSSGQSLSHVNYNFEVMDESGKSIESRSGVHTHTGINSHTVSFISTGSFKLVITVIGTGINPPFDTTRSGTVETAIMVVPEFPITPVILATATGLALVAARIITRRK